MPSSEDRGRSLIRARSTTSIHTERNHQQVPLNPQRAASVHHSGQTPKIREGSSDLRHTAIRNGLRRTASGNVVPSLGNQGQINHPGPALNKNIPMVPHEARPARNLGNRWANFTINQPLESQELASDHQDGVSVVHEVPVVQDVHFGHDLTTVKEVVPTSKASISPLTFVKNSTGESYPTAATTVLTTPTTPTTDNKFEDLHVDDSKLSESRSTQTSRFYHRMSAIISDRRSDHNSMSSLVPVSRYISELDTSDEDDDDADTKNSKDADDSQHQALTMDQGEPVSVLDIMNEINDFQTTLVERRSPQKENFTLSRTQQKLLDLKDLATYEQGQQGTTFKNLLDYAVKIQHEAILSEWTQLRLRFLSHATTKSETNVSCRAGVLGFVHRYKDVQRSVSPSSITEDEVSDYIQELWDDEFMKLVETPGRIALPTYDEGVDIYKDNSMLMSSLARSVMLSREST